MRRGKGTILSVHWRILIALTLARASMAYQFQLVPALAHHYVDELGLSYAQLGTLAGAYLLPGVLAALFGGWLGTRIGDFRTVALGLALMTGGGIIAALSANFDVLLAARVAAGVGAVCLNVLVTKMTGDWFQGRADMPTAMGILVSSWPAGLALAMLTIPLVDAAVGTMAAHVTAPLLCMLALILLAGVWTPPEADGAAAVSAPGALGSLPSRNELTLIFVSGVIWAIYNTAFIGIIAWGPGVMIASGMDGVAASAVVSLAGWTMIVSVPIGGWLASRTRRRDIVPLASFALSGALALGLAAGPSGAVAAPLLVALGLAIGPAAGLIMTLPVAVTRRAVRSVSMGIFLAIYYALMGGAPSALGWLLERTGDPAAPILASCVLFLSCIVIWLGFRLLEARLATAARIPAAPT